MRQLQLDKFSPSMSEISDEDLYQLVLRAQAGDIESSESLIWRFRNFLSKYYILLTTGKADLSDRDIRQFLSLYVAPPGSRGYLKGNKLNEQGRKRIQELIHRLNAMIAQADPEDVEQTLVLAFLACCKRYEKREGIEFLGFIKNYYRFIVQRYVNEYLLDQHGLHSSPLPEEGFLEDVQEQEVPEDEEEVDATDLALTTEGGLAGLLATPEGLVGEVWEILTQEEKWLLVWRFVDKEKLKQIGDRFGWTSREVKEKLNQIKEKLALITGRELVE